MMYKHEKKACPRCSTHFECKVGSILLCQCSTVHLSEVESDFIREQYSDCLCSSCMVQVKADYHNTKLRDKITRLLGLSGKGEQNSQE